MLLRKDAQEEKLDWITKFQSQIKLAGEKLFITGNAL